MDSEFNIKKIKIFIDDVGNIGLYTQKVITFVQELALY